MVFFFFSLLSCFYFFFKFLVPAAMATWMDSGHSFGLPGCRWPQGHPSTSGTAPWGAGNALQAGIVLDPPSPPQDVLPSLSSLWILQVWVLGRFEGVILGSAHLGMAGIGSVCHDS